MRAVSVHGRARRAAGLVAVLAAGAMLSGCADQARNLDWDLRRNGFSTAEAARAATGARPQPDARGVITYPGYQVAVARAGESVEDMAGRLGIGAEALARQNALAADATLRGGELLVLPGGSAGAAADGRGTIAVTPLAAPGADVPSVGPEPVRHTVARGETAFSIARLYNLPVRTIADWNGLPADLSVREGQVLIIPAPQSVTQAAASAEQESQDPTPAAVQVPAAGAAAGLPRPEPESGSRGQTGAAPSTTAATSAPGQGSATPTPPSASQPLPQSTPEPAGQGAGATANQSTGRSAAPSEPPVADMSSQRSDRPSLAMPVQGRIIRAYQRGRNDGIGIGAPAGAAVSAAAAGTVAAITRDASQVPILVIRHSGDLLTVYANIDDIRVERGAQVRAGQTIAQVRRGDPSFLHFEVREGLESVDPMRFLQ